MAALNHHPRLAPAPDREDFCPALRLIDMPVNISIRGGFLARNGPKTEASVYGISNLPEPNLQTE